MEAGPVAELKTTYLQGPSVPPEAMDQNHTSSRLRILLRHLDGCLARAIVSFGSTAFELGEWWVSGCIIQPPS